MIHKLEEEIKIGGSKVLKYRTKYQLTVFAIVVTVFEALKVAESLKEEGIQNPWCVLLFH
jgi:transketolase